MQTTATRFPRLALIGSTSRWGGWLLQQWHGLARDDDEGFLCEALDLADLERRLRRLERGRLERFGALRGLP